MWVFSPMPEIAEVAVLIPSVTGPSWANCPPLFKEPVMSGSEVIGKEAPMTSGESLQALMLHSDLTLSW